MSIRIIPKAQQGTGAFNGGEIVEKKPIGFPKDYSTVRPYSNLFYWVHARAVTDSTIGLHPHQGFDICFFVLKGEIRYYDTQMQIWFDPNLDRTLGQPASYNDYRSADFPEKAEPGRDRPDDGNRRDYSGRSSHWYRLCTMITGKGPHP